MGRTLLFDSQKHHYGCGETTEGSETMPVQIGLSNGEKWVVEGDFEATVNAMSGPGEMFTVEGGGGRRIYILRDQVAYVLEKGPGSVYEERGVVSAGE